MEQSRLDALLADLRAHRTESGPIEAKAARREVPKDALETLSAFANSAGGGTLLLGVSEAEGFGVTGVDNAAKIQADVVSWCNDRFTPPLRPNVFVDDEDGKSVVIVELDELPREEKPCFVTGQGLTRGCYLRVAESDRRLTPQEVQQLIAERGQPRFDREVVPEAVLEDLDTERVRTYVDRVRRSSPHAFEGADIDRVLVMTGVAGIDEHGVVRPSIGGLLALGRYPQQFLPQVNATFVSYPTTSGADANGVRFLDNVTADGPIPEMVGTILSAIRRNSSRRAVITGSERVDSEDFPETALREALVNALVHRDLSPGSRGSQVQVEMYPDRLVIRNPGGLYGAVDIAHLGDDGRSSARNGFLLRILEEVPSAGGGAVCENRGSGIRTMISALRRAGMAPPSFADGVTSFEVRFPNSTLLDDEVLHWIGSLTSDVLRDTQRLALAFLRKNEFLDNRGYRVLTGITDSRATTYELQDLVARELIDQHGTRRGTTYALSQLARDHAATGRRSRPDRRRQILDLIALNGEVTKVGVAEELALGVKAAEHWLRTLKKEGAITASSPPGSRTTSYRKAPHSPSS